MSRATQPLLKVIKVGSNAFFKSIRNEKNI